MERISKREFLLYPNKHIKPSEFVLTNRGEDKYVVTIKEVSTPLEVPLEDRTVKVFDTYGCGCQKISGQNLCKKHGRV